MVEVFHSTGEISRLEEFNPRGNTGERERAVKSTVAIGHCNIMNVCMIIIIYM